MFGEPKHLLGQDPGQGVWQHRPRAARTTKVQIPALLLAGWALAELFFLFKPEFPQL